MILMLLLKAFRNSKKQGDVGLAEACAWFTRNDFHVSIPLTDSNDYDLIVDDDDKLYRVQVRTTYHKTDHDIYKVNLAVSGGNRSGTGKMKYFNPKKIDLLFVLTENRDMYVIPSREIANTRTLNLGEKYKHFKVV
jgi:hypothetical protein